MNQDHEDDCVGFNLETQKLHCLVLLDDDIGKALSSKAGTAFFRAFIVEDRHTGEILTNMRYRYTGHDSWFRMRVGPDRQHLSGDERVQYLAGAVEKSLRTSLANLSGGVPSPPEAVLRFYPPHPEDSQNTIDWLLQQDLVEIVNWKESERVNK